MGVLGTSMCAGFPAVSHWWFIAGKSDQALFCFVCNGPIVASQFRFASSKPIMALLWKTYAGPVTSSRYWAISVLPLPCLHSWVINGPALVSHFNYWTEFVMCFLKWASLGKTALIVLPELGHNWPICGNYVPLLPELYHYMPELARLRLACCCQLDNRIMEFIISNPWSLLYQKS